MRQSQLHNNRRFVIVKVVTLSQTGRDRDRERQTGRETDRLREREGGRERERDRQTDRQTDRLREREGGRDRQTDRDRVRKLVFYAQLTSAVISGR